MKTRHTAARILGQYLLLTGLAFGQVQSGLSQPITSVGEAASAAPPASPNEHTPVAASPTPSGIEVTQVQSSRYTRLAPSHTRLSPWANEIVKLAQAGLEDRVLLAFIENSGTFNLGADQIIHLTGLGISSDVLSAMLQHDMDLASGARPLTTFSMPRMEPELERTHLALRNASGPTSSAVAAAPPRVTVVDREPAQVDYTAFTPTTAALDASVTPSKPKSEVNDATDLFKGNARTSSAPLPENRFGGYRVPETHSVELLPPIIVINSASPPPNVIILDMFPSSR